MAQANKPSLSMSGPVKPGMRMERSLGSVLTRADEKQPIRMSFSSETPYRRWFGMEILDHSDGAMDLSRLNDLGVVLFNHNMNQILGRVENPTIADRRGECEITFDEDEFAQVMKAKLERGTLRATSLRYSVEVWEEVTAGAKSSCGRYDGPCYIARKWTPLEVSLVSVPADPTVGVGRSEGNGSSETESEGTGDMGEDMNKGAVTPEQGTEQSRAIATPPVAQPVNLDEVRAAAAAAERARMTGIASLCRNAGMSDEVTQRLIDSQEMTLDGARAAVLEELMRTRAPQPGIGAGDGVTRDETDKFRSAASDALCMRVMSVSTPAQGAQELRGLSVKRLLERSLQQDGVNTSLMSDDEMISRAFMYGDGSFPAIMDQTVGKTVRDAYEAAPTTYQKWCRIGSLSDFKEVPTYRLGEADSLQLVPMNGELKQGVFVNQAPYKRKLDTYGITLGLSRQMIVNDDIGQFARIGQSYAQSSARDINRTVYKLLSGNPVFAPDGKPLFGPDHSNLVAASVLNVDSITKMRLAMRTQKGVDKKTILNLNPAYLIVPAALETDALRLLRSEADPSAAHSGVVNVVRNSAELIVEAELDAVSAAAHYMAASSGMVDTIEVDFLDGRNQISIRMSEMSGTLGMRWDIWLDYGVALGDYRGLVRNPGA